MGRVVSIDFGLKRIGLAISDERRIIATSLGVLYAEKTSKETIQQILNRLKSYEIETIIIGNPLQMNGKEGFLADEMKHFVSLLKEQVTCKIIVWDERLTSVQADRLLMECEFTRKKRSQKLDGVAATILLQSYLGYE